MRAGKQSGRAALGLVAAALLVPAGFSAAADEDGSLAAAVVGGDPGLDLRYRYEFVDQDGFADEAHASTLRLRLNYRTGRWRDVSAFIEFDHVAEVLIDDFACGAGTSGPRRDRYPAVVDPDGTDLNQLYLEYAPTEELRLRFGRQRILLDDQRFVGGVGWRQNEQTYDAASVHYSGLERTTLSYAYVSNVNRIFGPEVPAGDNDQDTHLFNVQVGLAEHWRVTGYAYLVDNDDVPAFSTRTLGIRADGGTELGKGKLDLVAEFATQSDAANAPANFDADYQRLQLTWSAGRVAAGLGLETLGSDNGEGFRTPLATLHAFNGWADQFLATPGAGLEDRYLRFGLKVAPWQLDFRYHDFAAEAGSADYGTEFDVAASRRFGSRYGLLVKLAAFRADNDAFSDVTKAWLMLSAGF